MIKIKTILKEISKVSKIEDGCAVVHRSDLARILLNNHTTLGHLSNHIKAVTNTYVCFDKNI